MSAGTRRWPQERDALPNGPMLAGIAAALVMVALSLAVAWWLLARWPGSAGVDLGERAIGFARPPARIGGIRQTDIEANEPAARRNARKREELATWGWVDRERGIVRIPLEEAIDVIVREARR